jgi:hypothetical protein
MVARQTGGPLLYAKASAPLPVTVPPHTTPGSGSTTSTAGGALAATGGTPALAGLALLVLATGAVAVRRRQRG